MITQTQEQILAFLLANPEEQFSIRGIAKELNKSYTLVYNNITDLENENIIIKQNVPPAKLVKLNKFIPTHIFVDIELKRKEKFLKKYLWIEIMLKDILMSTKNPFFILLIFGSYASGKATNNSDIDLLIIVQDKKNIKDIEDIIHKTYTKVKKGLNFIDMNDFIEMIKNPNKLNIGNEAKKNHIILYGVEVYYELLKRV